MFYKPFADRMVSSIMITIDGDDEGTPPVPPPAGPPEEPSEPEPPIHTDFRLGFCCAV